MKSMPQISDPTVGAQMAADPLEFFGGSHTRVYGINRAELKELQVEALRSRFDELHREIPMVAKVIDRAGVTEIRRIEDAVPLLFDHTMYKSYPSQLLTQRRFATLTTWLSRLTSSDLSGVDNARCTSLDDWLDELDRCTDLRVGHTSGTTGTLSLLPWSKRDHDQFISALALTFSQQFGDTADWRTSDPVDVIFPYFRHGGGMAMRQNDAAERLIAKGVERFHALYPGRVSSDVLHLAARLRAAAARGQAHAVDVPADMLARKDELEHLLHQMPEDVDNFLQKKSQELAGRPIWVLATWKMLFDMAESGLARGYRGVFSPESVVVAAGGSKGWSAPENWREQVLEFFGARRLEYFYGMSEVALTCRLCAAGHYHTPPWIIPYVLDPDDGTALPRTGTVTGRAAFFDLLASNRWGGFISGDEVTLHWDAACECGRTTAYYDGQIERFSEKRGGDDKITCVATPDVHSEALNYLNDLDEVRS
jgi:hypothetical protein